MKHHKRMLRRSISLDKLDEYYAVSKKLSVKFSGEVEEVVEVVEVGPLETHEVEGVKFQVKQQPLKTQGSLRATRRARSSSFSNIDEWNVNATGTPSKPVSSQDLRFFANPDDCKPQGGKRRLPFVGHGKSRNSSNMFSPRSERNLLKQLSALEKQEKKAKKKAAKAKKEREKEKEKELKGEGAPISPRRRDASKISTQGNILSLSSSFFFL